MYLPITKKNLAACVNLTDEVAKDLRLPKGRMAARLEKKFEKNPAKSPRFIWNGKTQAVYPWLLAGKF